MLSRLSSLRRLAPIGRHFATATPTSHDHVLQNGSTMHYVRYGPEYAKASIVLCHGAPGSHNDFKHLSPLLATENLNVIAFDLPGNGKTSAEAAGGTYGLNERAMAEAVVEVLDPMNLQNCFVLGHSFGGHTAMRVAASAKSIRGLALLTSVGLRPHHVVRRFPMVEIGRLLQNPTPLRPLMVLLNKWYYLYGLKFSKRTPQDDFTYALQRIGSSDFEGMKTIANQIDQRKLATFVALALDDAFIEPEIIQELGQALPSGVRIEFPTGGHNIQKTRAKELASAIHEWIDSHV